MHQYITQTEYAVSNLISLIHSEANQLNDLQNKKAKLQVHHKELYERFLGQDSDPDGNYSDTQIMQSYIVQFKFYESNISPINKAIHETQLAIAAKEESIKALSGAILQIAKQGISIVHQQLVNAPNGRLIMEQPIKNIIWQGRNQSMHFEEGRYSTHVKDCFEQLNIPLTNENLAKEIIDLLEWNSYEQYCSDMTQILSERDEQS
ncbi:hypothetical protein [Lysinibacillus capsici]|uniref:hypothetical protein n=1 Tax=Lysinibacillus capsici TaxID=2115968 RepID=UPI001CDA5387|nr:hypothetical protein [Lysinibacillus capsici]